MQTTLMLPMGDRAKPRIPLDLAGEVFRSWRGCITRVYVENTLAWMGRASEIDLHDQDDRTCSVDVIWSGHAFDLEREAPQLDASYSDEFAVFSASALIQSLIDQSDSLIAKRYVNVQETAVNIGAVGTSMQDTILSLILNQLKGASSSGVEFAFLIWDPADGPYLIPIGVGPTDYRLFLAGSPGTGVKWSLSEYVDNVRAIFTNADRVSDATDWTQSIDGALLNGGLHSSRAISVDAVNLEGAQAARDAFAALHNDPLGVTGSFRTRDFVMNDEGAMVLAGLVRAGQIVVVPDVLPFDPILTRASRTWAIASTSYDPINGTGLITLDQRSIQSRENERMTDIRVGQRTADPGGGGILAQAFDAGGTSAADATVVLLDGVTLAFTATRREEVEIVCTAELSSATGSSGGRVFLGYTLDGEGFDFNDNTQASMTAYAANGNVGEHQSLELRRRRTVQAGPHRVDFWGEQDTIGATCVYVSINARVSR